jgi:sugar lactone lactonase YvrE
MSPRTAIVTMSLVLGATVVAGATAQPRARTSASPYKVVGGWGKAGTGQGEFSSDTRGITTDQAGNVWVADTDNNRVQEFSASGTFIRQWGATGVDPGYFQVAKDVAIGPDGTVWVADQQNSRIQVFTPDGTLTRTYATPANEIPRGIAVDANGNAYAAFEGAAAGGVRKYSTEPNADPLGSSFGTGGYRTDDTEASPDGTIYLLTSSTTTADDDIRRFSADGTPLGAFKIGVGDGTRGISVDLDCNVWATNNTKRRIVKYSPSGQLLATASSPDLVSNDIAVGPKGDLYVIEQNKGIVHFAQNPAAPATAAIPSKLAVGRGAVVKVPYTLRVACPNEVSATASLAGKGISGKATGLKLAAGKKTVISIPLAKGALKKAAKSVKATFKIVLATNGRPTTETRSVTVVVPAGVR